MHYPESTLDRARREATVAKARVSAQAAIIKALVHCECNTAQADDRLAVLLNAAELTRLRLIMEEKRAFARGQ